LLLEVDIILTSLLAACAAVVGTMLFLVFGALCRGEFRIIPYLLSHLWAPKQLPSTMLIITYYATVWFIPAFVGRLWLLAYVLCGLLLKSAPWLQIFLKWFNRRFDIENHPLQSIGVVAGILTAVGYWFLAIIHLLP
jgi:hypothetical protein